MTNEIALEKGIVEMTPSVAMKPSSAYYPSREELSRIMEIAGPSSKIFELRKGYITRTDGFDVNEAVEQLDGKESNEAFLSRLLSVADLTEKTYDRFKANPNSLMNWFKPLRAAVQTTDTFFKIPQTNAWRLPIELAQFIRIEYQQTREVDRQLFNELIFDALNLEDDKTYFIKTGLFSSKFQYANARCAEPREMGEYLQVINNFAMYVGAGECVDVVAREYIEDVENNPTIYNGMPLRTEFRAFVDFDTNDILGVVNYWHPIVMKRALSSGLADTIEQDYQTYLAHEDKLISDYNQHVNRVKNELAKLIPNIDLKGQYSIDVMKNGDDFYIIDMALMATSALAELI